MNDIDLFTQRPDNLTQGVFVNTIDENSFKDFRIAFEYFRENGNYPFIPVIVDSFGGCAYSMFGMIDIMMSSNKPVITMAVSKAMSAGAAILCCGTPGHRFVSPNATVMLHHVSQNSFGMTGLKDMRNDVNELQRLDNRMFKLMETQAQKPPGFFANLIGESQVHDLYIEPERCVEHGIVDHIGYPVLNVTTDFSYDIVQPVESETPKRKTRKSK